MFIYLNTFNTTSIVNSSDSNNEGVHPTSTLSGESNSAMGVGQRVGDPVSSQPALGRDKEGDSGDTLSDTSPPTENGRSPSGSSGSEGHGGVEREREKSKPRGHKGRWSRRLRHRVPSRVYLALAEDDSPVCSTSGSTRVSPSDTVG